jgi:hypothetical protein
MAASHPLTICRQCARLRTPAGHSTADPSTGRIIQVRRMLQARAGAQAPNLTGRAKKAARSQAQAADTHPATSSRLRGPHTSRQKSTPRSTGKHHASRGETFCVEQETLPS